MPEQDQGLFSRYVRRARGPRTMAQMAELLGVSQPAIAARERDPAGENVLRSTAEVLGMSLEEFLLDQVLQDEPDPILRQMLQRRIAKLRTGETSAALGLAEVLNRARLARGVGARELRETVPGVDRAKSQKNAVRETTVVKAAEALGQSVHEILRNGLLYDPEFEAGARVDQEDLRRRLNVLVATGHAEARARAIAAAARLHEGWISKFRRAGDLENPALGALSDDAAKRLLEVVEGLEKRLRLVLGAGAKRTPKRPAAKRPKTPKTEA